MKIETTILYPTIVPLTIITHYKPPFIIPFIGIVSNFWSKNPEKTRPYLPASVVASFPACCGDFSCTEIGNWQVKPGHRIWYHLFKHKGLAPCLGERIAKIGGCSIGFSETVRVYRSEIDPSKGNGRTTHFLHKGLYEFLRVCCKLSFFWPIFAGMSTYP